MIKFGRLVQAPHLFGFQLPSSWPSLQVGDEVIILEDKQDTQTNCIWYKCVPVCAWNEEEQQCMEMEPCLLPSAFIFAKRRPSLTLNRPPSPPSIIPTALESRRPSVESLPSSPPPQLPPPLPLPIDTSIPSVQDRITALEISSRSPSASPVKLSKSPSLREPLYKTVALPLQNTLLNADENEHAKGRKGRSPRKISLTKAKSMNRPLSTIELYRRLHSDVPSKSHFHLRSLPSLLTDEVLGHQGSSIDFRKSFLLPSSNAGSLPLTMSPHSEPVHLFFEFKACVASICGPGETTELVFSIYNRNEKKFATEQYSVTLSSYGMPTDENKIGKLYTVFADLSRKEINSQLFLVCRIVRHGRMIWTEREMMSTSSGSSLTPQEVTVRRPFGYAVLDLAPILGTLYNAGVADETTATEVKDGVGVPTIDDEREYLMRIYTPVNENAFSTLFEQIINRSGGYETSSRAESICVGLRALHGDLKTILDTELKSLPSSPELTERKGFPEVILPGYVRNTIYVDLVSGEFLQGRKTSAKNVEVAVQVRLSSGSTLPCSISTGSGCESLATYESTVYYHNNSPRWMETLRVDIPVERFDRGTHLFFTFRHCSTSEKSSDKNEKAFAFGILPLMRIDGTINDDRVHMLHLFKYDKKIAVPEVYAPILLAHMNFSGKEDEQPTEQLHSAALVAPAAEPTLTAAFVNSKIILTKDQFSVRTTLCSTKLTQDTSLLNLLRWKSLPEDRLRSVLKDFTFIGPVEMIKYLQDIFNTLFAILQHYSQTSSCPEMVELTVYALSFILNMVITDRRFTSFRPILDVYVQDHFGKFDNIDHVWLALVETLLKVASAPEDAVLGKELRRMLKALEYLFKFIHSSWSHYIATHKSPELEEAQFRTGIVRLMDTIAVKILQDGDDGSSMDHAKRTSGAVSSLIGTQILVLQNIHHAMAELSRLPVFDKMHLAKTIIRYLRSLPSEKRKVIETKLELCMNVMDLDLFTQDDFVYEMLAQSFCDLIHEYLSKQYDANVLDMCVNMFLELIHCMQNRNASDRLIRVKVITRALNEVLVTAQRLTGKQEALLPEEMRLRSKCCVVLVSSLELMSPGDLLESVTELKSVLSSIFGSWFTDPSMYEQWAGMSRIYCREFLRCLDGFAEMDLHQTPPFHTDLINLLVLTLRLLSIVFEFEQNQDVSSVRGDLEVPIQGLVAHATNIMTSVWSSAMSSYENAKVECSAVMEPLLELMIHSLSNSHQTPLQDSLVNMLKDMLMAREHQSQNIRSGNVESPKELSPIVPEPMTSITQEETDGELSLSNLQEFVAQWTSAQVKCIDSLDRLIMNERKGDEQFHQRLVEKLTCRFSGHSKELRFVRVMDEFLGLAIAVRDAGVESKTTYHADDTRRSTTDSLDHETSTILDDTGRALLLSRLLQFTALLNQHQMYTKYVHQLVDIHLKHGRFAEAACSLKLHADLYDWDKKSTALPLCRSVSLSALKLSVAATSCSDTTLTGQISRNRKHISSASSETHFDSLVSAFELDSLFESQTAAERREILYLVAIRLFFAAKHYEPAIRLCEKLGMVYRKVLFDFTRLASLHHVQSILYQSILTTDRFYPDYYRIAFIGKGWSNDGIRTIGLRNKHFICRSHDWETLGDIVERMLGRFPGAELMKTNSLPVEEVFNTSNKRLLQICKVEPTPNRSAYPELFDDANKDCISDRAKEWYMRNETKVFRFSRPFKKNVLRKASFMGMPDDGNEFLHLWIEEFTLICDTRLPSFLNWCEVVKYERREISPIENAVRTVESKNDELENLERQYRPYASQRDERSIPASRSKRISAVSGVSEKRKSTTVPVNCNPFTMSINGAVDAPVNGGIPMYRRAFLHPAYLQQNPDDHQWINRLQIAIQCQVEILRRCIALHEQIVPAEMRPLHDSIVTFFKRNFDA